MKVCLLFTIPKNNKLQVLHLDNALGKVSYAADRSRSTPVDTCKLEIEAKTTVTTSYMEQCDCDMVMLSYKHKVQSYSADELRRST